MAPQDCGQCHTNQWQQWQTSLHSRSMGPGLMWQLQVMDQAQGNLCLRCHAPLAEQKGLLARDLGWPTQPKGEPPSYVPAALAQQGLVCAACHVRGHRRYGPPPSAPTPASAPVHGGFEPHDAFADSRFCAHCHQFPADGPQVAGKLNEDTYEQWKASPQAAQGQSCQSCHMPQRQHLWRGIHDADMTRRAIEVSLTVQALGQGRHLATANVRNIGAGHHFPTYMVPKVELQFWRVGSDERRVALGAQQIGWNVDVNLQRETQDTRIPAGQARRFEQHFEAPEGGPWQVELLVRVRPGEHYERTFRHSLGNEARLPEAARAPLRAALDAVQSAEYTLLSLRQAPTRIAN